MSKLLTIVAPNRNRIADNNSSNFFFKSLAWQTNKEFDLIIIDGGSSNFDEVKAMARKYDSRTTVMQHVLGKVFMKPLLNNMAIRTAKTPYILTTDVDMLYAPKFVETVVSNLGENVMVESRSMYWKQPMVDMIYSGEVDPEKDIDSCKRGRIKKITTCGGAQCMHINSWNKLRGFDEAYVGWGSEDYDLLIRASKAGLKIKWIGDSLGSIMLFHQPHYKELSVLTMELEEQEKNKVRLANIKDFAVNPKGWGGIDEARHID